MSNRNNDILVRNITELMKKHRITQITLAEAINISQPQLSKVLNQKDGAQFSLDDVWLIAEYFNVSIDYLVGRKTNFSLKDETPNKEICKLLIHLIETETIKCKNLTIEEDAYKILENPEAGDLPYYYESETNQYFGFFFSRYISIDEESWKGWEPEEKEQYYMTHGNANEKGAEIQDFLSYYFKLHDLLENNSLPQDIYETAINDRLDKLMH